MLNKPKQQLLKGINLYSCTDQLSEVNSSKQKIWIQSAAQHVAGSLKVSQTLYK
jgi:hypothetical protein